MFVKVNEEWIGGAPQYAVSCPHCRADLSFFFDGRGTLTRRPDKCSHFHEMTSDCHGHTARFI